VAPAEFGFASTPRRRDGWREGLRRASPDFFWLTFEARIVAFSPASSPRCLLDFDVFVGVLLFIQALISVTELAWLCHFELFWNSK
jgi:hypothetical protein